MVLCYCENFIKRYKILDSKIVETIFKIVQGLVKGVLMKAETPALKIEEVWFK
jgi:hypothetical protein